MADTTSMQIVAPNGRAYTVDYWMFRELLTEAARICKTNGDTDHMWLCHKMQCHLAANHD